MESLEILGKLASDLESVGSGGLINDWAGSPYTLGERMQVIRMGFMEAAAARGIDPITAENALGRKIAGAIGSAAGYVGGKALGTAGAVGSVGWEMTKTAPYVFVDGAGKIGKTTGKVHSWLSHFLSGGDNPEAVAMRAQAEEFLKLAEENRMSAKLRAAGNAAGAITRPVKQPVFED